MRRDKKHFQNRADLELQTNILDPGREAAQPQKKTLVSLLIVIELLTLTCHRLGRK